MKLETEIIDFLRLLIEEEADRAEDHLAWLQSDEAAEEGDRELQVAESERAISMAAKAAVALG